MKSSPNPVLLWMSVLAGLQTFFAGSTVTTVMVEANVLLTAIFAFGALAVGAAQFGIQFYVRGQVTPNANVVERATENGTVVAGPANEIVAPGTLVRDVGGVPAPVDPGPPARPVDPPPAPKLVFAELDPRYAGAFQPDYPASEQRREIEGVAKVRVLIGTDGRVKAVELVSTDSPGFFAETKRRALAKWRFTPATRGGVAEESWKTMTVRFEIRAA